MIPTLTATIQLEADDLLVPKLHPPPSTSNQRHKFESCRSSETVFGPPTDISEEDIKDALELFVRSKSCYKMLCYKSPKKIIIESISVKNAYKYSLKTCEEYRETVWKLESLMNEPLEGIHKQRGPWEYKVEPISSFVDESKAIRIPNKAMKRICHTCQGNKKIKCNNCAGRGKINCTYCPRNPSTDGTEVICRTCAGNGTLGCGNCSANGTILCATCNGLGELRMYMELIVTWKSHEDEHFSNPTEVPDRKFSKARPTIALHEDGQQISPINHCPDKEINTISKNLVGKHYRDYTAKGIILKQLQILEAFRVAKVHYTWKDTSGLFYIYGEDNRVYFPAYPNKRCCTIL